jgi:hypothetical protein
MRVTFKQPSNFTASTTDIIIAGQIRNLGDTLNCQADFRFSLTRKP